MQHLHSGIWAPRVALLRDHRGSLCLLSSSPSWGPTLLMCALHSWPGSEENQQRDAPAVCPDPLVIQGHLQNSWPLQTVFLTVCQLHRGREMTRLVRTAVSWGSGVPRTALCVCHPAVNTQPTMALRHSNLKLLFGKKKDSSAHVMASTRGVSSSLAGDNWGQTLSFTQRTPCSRERVRSTPGEAVPWEHSRSWRPPARVNYIESQNCSAQKRTLRWPSLLVHVDAGNLL